MLLDLQATAGNRAVARLVSQLGPPAGGPPPTVQRRWEMKYTIAGQSKQQRKAARGGRHFWQTVGMTAVGLRADVNASKVGAGVSSGGHHAEDELIRALGQLALGGHLLPNATNTLAVRKLDASPCTSTPRSIQALPRRKVVRKVKSKYGGKITKRRSYVPDRRKHVLRRTLQVVTSEKGGGVAGCTERLIDLKRHGVSVGGQVFGFQQITIEANNYYQGGPGRDLGGHRIAALERIAASVAAAAEINNEPGMSITITPGAIGMGKGRR
ncbi:MAG TPA: hypothetical protein VFW71_12830 [Actinomycetota bacterium]|nr:hypothetical protein [Actinomycetota bacterium]